MLDFECLIPPLAVDLTIDTELLLDDAASMILHGVITRFLQQVSTSGEKWVPSKAALRRKMRGIAGGTLYDTGDLFRSLATVKVDDSTRSIGTNVPYAAQHEFGLMNWPKRDFLGVSDSDFVALDGLMDSRFRAYLK